MGEMPLSLKLDAQTAASLKREADRLQVDLNEVAGQAIKAYLDFQERERTMLHDLIAEADKGEFVSEDAMLQWMDRLENDIDAPAPNANVFITRT